MLIEYCGLGAESDVFWFDGSAWALVSPQVYDPLTGCMTLSLDDASSPTLAQLTGTPFAASGVSIYLPVIRK